MLLLHRALLISIVAASSAAMAGESLFLGRFGGNDWLGAFNSFRAPPWTEGLERAELVLDQTAERSVLAVSYPARQFGNDTTGAQWKTYLDRARDHLTLSYRVKFQPGFDFVKGGKLPGLVGGHRHGSPDSVISGGVKPDGTDGWSARIMWRRGGKIVQYVYHPDQPGNYGEDFAWVIGGEPVRFVPGAWHEVRTEIQMNTPGQRDGALRSWLDGRLALDRRNVRFRDVPRIGIDALYFSTFFGGDDPSWSTTKNERVYFDDFVIELGADNL